MIIQLNFKNSKNKKLNYAPSGIRTRNPWVLRQQNPCAQRKLPKMYLGGNIPESSTYNNQTPITASIVVCVLACESQNK